MKCPHCGREVANDSIFCEYCGKKIREQRNMAKLWIALAIIWGIFVQGSCLFLIYKLNTIEKIHDNQTDNAVVTQPPLQEYETDIIPIVEHIDTTDIISIETETTNYATSIDRWRIDTTDIISIETETTAKTIAQLEQEADVLLKNIKKYEETIITRKETIKGLAKQVEKSVKDLDKKDFSASQEILNLANMAKDQINNDKRALDNAVKEAKRKQTELSKMNATDKITQAKNIIQKYENAQKEAQDCINQRNNNIQKIQNHINRLQEENKNQTQNTQNKNLIKKQKTLRKQYECNLMYIFQELNSAKCFNIKWQTTDDKVVKVIRFKGNVSIQGISAGQARVTGEDDTYIYVIDVIVK